MKTKVRLAKIGLWLLKAVVWHKWKYRNPHCRTCTVCGRHEVEHCVYPDKWNPGYWEVFDEGDWNLHYEGEA